MKAPSFGSAARRILARGLGATIGLAPAYLRLRAAGEQEVLLRVERTSAGAGAVPRLVVVPNGTYQFTPAPDPLSSAGGEPAPA